MRTGFLLGLVTLGSVLCIGCSGAQSPSSTLSSKPDASVASDRWRVAATGTRVGDDQIEIAMMVSRTTDPPQVISQPRIMLVIGQQGTVEITDGSFDISATVDSSWNDGRVNVDIKTAIREGGVLKSSPRIRMSIE